MESVLCDAKMPNLKGKVHKDFGEDFDKTGADIWGRDLDTVEVTGGERKGYWVTEVIRKMPGVTCITEKIREARLIWFGHVMRK